MKNAPPVPRARRRAFGGLSSAPKKFFSMGMAGGVMSSLQGGKFGHGFVSAGTGAVMPGMVGEHISGQQAQTVAAALVGGTVSAMTGGKFANGAAMAAFSSGLGRAIELALDRQMDGVNASLTDEQIEIQARRVKGNLSSGKKYASKALTAYCTDQPSSCSDFSASDFDAIDFRWSKDLFFPGESKKSMGFTGAYVDRNTSPPSVVLFAGGIALQGKGTGRDAVAEVLLHEFRHLTPKGTALSQEYWQSNQRLPYMQRIHEIDAFNFSRDVMRYGH